MVPNLANIFWLGTKEFRSLAKEPLMILFIIWSFVFAIYTQATGGGETINNTAIAIVDEDHSQLSRSIADLFSPPYFQTAKTIDAANIARAMDEGLYTVIVNIPPDFEKDIRKGRNTEIQINVDATASQQAMLGAAYVQRIVMSKLNRYQNGVAQLSSQSQSLVVRRAFNPNGTQSWFRALVALGNEISMVMIILTGASLLREREHGTIEHLLVMPLSAFEIALAKVWANGVVIIAAFVFSLLFIVEELLAVPVAGSHGLLLLGTIIYVFAAAAIGIFLGTLARTMAQFALLMLMAFVPMMILSGGLVPVESQPQWVQYVTWLLPSRHYLALVQAIAIRGADITIVWQEFVIIFVMGGMFLAASLLLFRRSIATT